MLILVSILIYYFTCLFLSRLLNGEMKQPMPHADKDSSVSYFMYMH